MRVKFDINDEKIGYALLRVMLGMNLMMHGVSRIKLGPGEFAGTLVIQFANTGLPHWLLVSFGVLLPGVEALLGFLLVTGLRTRAALVGAGTLMIALTFGSSLIQNWSAAATQLTYGAIISALLFLRRFNGWSVDAWMGRD
jgi:thiosulfate dehydrogenase (quinone) large subunit